MSVTSIKSIINQTGFGISFLKLENVEDNGIIHPGLTSYNEVWIPWCDNAEQFSQKALVVQVNNDLRFFIWQSGPLIYYNQAPVKEFSTGQPYIGLLKPPQPVPYVAIPSQYYKPKQIPGLASIGGDRKLIVMRTNKHNAVLNQFFTISLMPL